MTEQFVFQQLNQNETLSIYYHTFERSKYGIDFLIQNENDDIIPIEVKSGESLRAKRFKSFCEKYKPQTAVRTSLSEYKEESWMTNVPLYMLGEFLVK